MSRFPWLKMKKKTDPEAPLETPIWLGNRSNGEYFHAQTPREAFIRQKVLEKSDSFARRLGMDRREFLVSAGGIALTTAVTHWAAGCSGNNGFTMPEPDAHGDDAGVLDCVAQGRPGLDTSQEFIFDIQTHHFDPTGEWRTKNALYETFLGVIAGSGCGRGNPDAIADCYSRERYAEILFLESDTTVSVLSSWPATTCSATVQTNCGLPMPNDSIAATRDWINGIALSQRVVNHCQVMPNLVLQEQLDVMETIARNHGVAGWKCYPAWTPTLFAGGGFWLYDDIGRSFVERGLELGVNVFCVHKGLPIPGFDVTHNQPLDVGIMAREYPNARFIIYHSGIMSGLQPGTDYAEGPYDPSEPNPVGINMLIRNLIDNNIAPNSNVYAELGSCWSEVMNHPEQAVHVIGKLLRYVGENNVVWGSDSLVNIHPQMQIAAFRDFTIPQMERDMYGYPELTDQIKRKIFGLNAAAVYGIDANAVRCEIQSGQIARIRRDLDGELGGNRWAGRAPLGPRTRREFVELARRSMAEGRPG